MTPGNRKKQKETGGTRGVALERSARCGTSASNRRNDEIGPALQGQLAAFERLLRAIFEKKVFCGYVVGVAG